MISILDPRMWLAFIMSGLLCFGAGYATSYKSAKTKYEFQVAKDNKAAQYKYDQMVSDKDATISIIQSKFDSLDKKYEKDTNNANHTIDKLQRSVSNGTYRMSVAVRSCKTGTASGDTGTASASATQEYAELLPETAHDIINVARDADKEVRRTNECIDRYNIVRDELKELNKKLLELSKP